jgi:peptidoglycan/LPS O-acetylase OafA/YrhL
MFVMVIVLGSRMVLLLDPKVSMTIETPGGTIRSSMLVSMLGSFASLLGLSYTALKFMLDTLLLNIFAIVFSVFEYKLAIKLIDDNFSGSLSSTFTYIATSSYCVYLFHRPFLALWNAGTNFISSPILRDITVFFVALPLLFFICYHIQIFEWSSKQHFSHKKTSDKNLPFKILVTSFLNNQMEHLRSRKV